MNLGDLAAAVNRVADALFTIAKAQKQGVKAQEQLVAIQTELMDMQKANLAVTMQLEQALAAQARGEHGASH